MASTPVLPIAQELGGQGVGPSDYQRSSRADPLMAAAFRRVLVGFDGSPDAAEALRVATVIAGLDGGHVVALSVLRHSPVLEGGSEHDGQSQRAPQTRRGLLRRAQAQPVSARRSPDERTGRVLGPGKRWSGRE